MNMWLLQYLLSTAALFCMRSFSFSPLNLCSHLKEAGHTLHVDKAATSSCRSATQNFESYEQSDVIGRKHIYYSPCSLTFIHLHPAYFHVVLLPTQSVHPRPTTLRWFVVHADIWTTCKLNWTGWTVQLQKWDKRDLMIFAVLSIFLIFFLNFFFFSSKSAVSNNDSSHWFNSGLKILYSLLFNMFIERSETFGSMTHIAEKRAL